MLCVCVVCVSIVKVKVKFCVSVLSQSQYFCLTQAQPQLVCYIFNLDNTCGGGGEQLCLSILLYVDYIFVCNFHFLLKYLLLNKSYLIFELVLARESNQ